MTYHDILQFWFEDIQPAAWFQKNVEFDKKLKKKFQAIHTQARLCELYTWRKSPQGRLAEIIILDQFSRNIYRDTPQAFSCDPLALALAQEAIAIGDDKVLTAQQRSFLYMPFMHSESLAIHEVAVDLYEKNGIESNLAFESQHRDIIKRFGRYPHRNSLLGRVSTREEEHFLSLAGSSF